MKDKQTTGLKQEDTSVGEEGKSQTAPVEKKLSYGSSTGTCKYGEKLKAAGGAVKPAEP